MPTVRVYQAGGQGYIDTTTNGQGDVIGTATYSEDGKVVQHMETDPATGTIKTTKYKDSKPDSSETKNADGATTQKEEYNDKGQLDSVADYGEDGFGPTEQTDYDYDKKGKVTQVSKHDGGGVITETTFYEYDEDGNLRKAERTTFSDETGEVEREDTIEYDEDGNVVSTEGNVDGIIDGNVKAKKDVGQPGPGTHVTPGPDDTSITVTHNPDGSFEVVVKDKYGRIISWQHLRPAGGCYLGGECPLHDEKKEDPLLDPEDITMQQSKPKQKIV
ncbi:MAG: hypothetical protein ABW148_07050 [Sedimenticola sp.]